MTSRICASCVQFGVTSDGKPVRMFVLRDPESGVEARFIELGAAIQALFVPDSSGRLEDVVLGYNTVAEYESNGTYNGVIVGRAAGRTAFGQFSLNGETFNLSRNCGEHSHHGGVRGLSRHLWKGVFVRDEQGVAVQFDSRSEHLEDGYPGEACFSVQYRLRSEGDSFHLCVRIQSQVDRPCPIAPVSHVTFNLNGEPRAPNALVSNHMVTLESNRLAETEHGVLNGRFCEAGGPLDLRKGRLVVHSEPFGGYDHVFCNEKFDRKTPTVLPVASVRVHENGRTLVVHSDQPATLLYAGYYLQDVRGKHNLLYKKYSGLAVECQNFPNAVNLRNFPAIPDPVLRPGQTFVSNTEFEFRVESAL